MKNIIITGGELFNKGAQAMTFIAINEMKSRFPEHRVLLLSEQDRQRPEKEKAQYAFDFMGWYPLKFTKCQSNHLLRVINQVRNGKELKEAEEIYKNTDLMIDISGYALGSNWSIEYCNSYLDHLEFALAFGIPMYLMPQSFGPFEFKGVDGEKLDQRIQKLLPTAKRIFAREKEGYEALVQKYHLNNVSLAGDLVLNNQGINRGNIYRIIPTIVLPEISKGSVAVIPNNRNLAVGDSKHVMDLYKTAICEMLKEAPNVYIVSHSSQDLSMCREIKKLFVDDDRVVLLEQDFSCIEFSDLVSKFKYVVASRFHAIVHSFKQGVPCVALGWATKYYDLMKMFNQEMYSLDVRSDVSREVVCCTIQRMQRNYENEKELISSRLSEVQVENTFDMIQL